MSCAGGPSRFLTWPPRSAEQRSQFGDRSTRSAAGARHGWEEDPVDLNECGPQQNGQQRGEDAERQCP